MEDKKSFQVYAAIIGIVAIVAIFTMVYSVNNAKTAVLGGNNVGGAVRAVAQSPVVQTSSPSVSPQVMTEDICPLPDPLWDCHTPLPVVPGKKDGDNPACQIIPQSCFDKCQFPDNGNPRNMVLDFSAFSDIEVPCYKLPSSIVFSKTLYVITGEGEEVDRSGELICGYQTGGRNIIYQATADAPGADVDDVGIIAWGRNDKIATVSDCFVKGHRDGFRALPGSVMNNNAAGDFFLKCDNPVGAFSPKTRRYGFDVAGGTVTNSIAMGSCVNGFTMASGGITQVTAKNVGSNDGIPSYGIYLSGGTATSVLADINLENGIYVGSGSTLAGTGSACANDGTGSNSPYDITVLGTVTGSYSTDQGFFDSGAVPPLVRTLPANHGGGTSPACGGGSPIVMKTVVRKVDRRACDENGENCIG